MTPTPTATTTATGINEITADTNIKRKLATENVTTCSPQNSVDIRVHINNLSNQFAETATQKNILSGLVILEKMGFYFVLKAFFVDMNWKPTTGAKVAVASLIREYQLKRVHKSLIRCLLGRMEEFGILVLKTDEREGQSTWEVSKLPPSASVITDTIKRLQTQLLAYPECNMEVEFLNHTGGNLYNALRGRKTGLDILFPAETSPDFTCGASALYANSLLMVHAKTNYIVSGILETIRQMTKVGQKSIRILEIGAGTGGTTMPLLEAIFKHVDTIELDLHYAFTDISNFFITRAKGKFDKLFPKVKFDFGILDIEQPVEGQGYGDKINSFDIIMAADVLHATQYLDDTLIHTRSLLKPGGILALGEIFRSTIMLECSFGLTEGWWRYGDQIRGRDSPLIDESGWETVLSQFGFANILTCGAGNYGAILAHADPTRNQ